MAAFGGVVTANSRDPGAKNDELLVGISAGTSVAAASSRVQNATPNGTEVAHRNEKLGYMAVTVAEESEASTESATAERLRRVPGVKYVEENATHQLMDADEPNDPKFDDQYAPQQVRAPEAWKTTTGSDDVTIAVIDTGIKYDHPDLEGQFGENKGKDFVSYYDDDPYPSKMDREYHGAHVAGIAAATTDNGTGIAGMSDATLLSCRVVDPYRRGAATSDMADAVQWAADQGADLINMSLGGGGYSRTMKNAVSYAVDNGTLPIIASGNKGDEEQGVAYPAAYDESVAVGAVDENESVTDFSQSGPSLDVVAPGKSVLSCSTRKGGYEELPGTSMACPAVAGVAALGLAAHPEWSISQLRSKLKETAVDVGEDENHQGAGRVDAANLVGVSDGNSAPSASFTVSPASPDVGEEVSFDASGSTDSDGTITRYEWTFGDGSTATGESVTHSFTSSETYTVTLTVEDDEGGSDSVSKTLGVGGSNATPAAAFTVSPSSPTVREEVTFDASGSNDTDGTIESYEWDFGDGITKTGETVTHAYESAGDHAVSLTVADDAGATHTVAKSVTVQSEGGESGGQCGDETNVAEVSGTLNGGWASDAYAYTTKLDDPCQVTVSLDGPSGADFDLYVNTDGTQPATYAFDKRSATQGSQEQIILEDVEPGQKIGILVDSYSGRGQFTLTSEEIGR
jgi:serine protease